MRMQNVITMQKQFEGLTMQNNMLMYIVLEFHIMRDLLINKVCPQLGLNPPPANPPPNLSTDFPKPDNSTSSDDSSPTVSKQFVAFPPSLLHANNGGE
jgi:hypothetical protein